VLRPPKKCNVHLGQKVPRLENPDSDEKDALFGLDTQITILEPSGLELKKIIIREIKIVDFSIIIILMPK
jgi:hypothetical protein